MEHLGKYNNLLRRGVHDSVVLGNGISRGFDQYEMYLDRPKATDLQRDNFCTHKQEVGELVRSALTDSSVLTQYTTNTAVVQKPKHRGQNRSRISCLLRLSHLQVVFLEFMKL